MSTEIRGAQERGALAAERAEATQFGRADRCVGPLAEFRVALMLHGSRSLDARADRRRRLARRARDDFVERNARDLDVQIDPVEQRTREFRNVPRHRRVVAAAVARPRSTESARTGLRCSFANRPAPAQGPETAGRRLRAPDPGRAYPKAPARHGTQ